MSSFIPSIVALGPLALVAALLAAPFLPDGPSQRARPVRRALLVATVIQTLHFAEEAAFGFHIAFPALFGLPPMSWVVFSTFNLACILLWLCAAMRIAQGHFWTVWAAWFLALAGVLNGVAHPVMAMAVDSYFPGLMTAPVLGIACVILLFRLIRIRLFRIR